MHHLFIAFQVVNTNLGGVNLNTEDILLFMPNDLLSLFVFDLLSVEKVESFEEAGLLNCNYSIGDSAKLTLNWRQVDGREDISFEREQSNALGSLQQHFVSFSDTLNKDHSVQAGDLFCCNETLVVY